MGDRLRNSILEYNNLGMNIDRNFGLKYRAKLNSQVTSITKIGSGANSLSNRKKLTGPTSCTDISDRIFTLTTCVNPPVPALYDNFFPFKFLFQALF